MDTAQALLQSLHDGQVVGPDHHRFKLAGSAKPHPLGQLWQAEDLSATSSTQVTLFFIDPPLIKHKGLLDNLKKQLLAAKSISHRHIAHCYGYFVEKRSLLFFAVEALDGLTLDELITHKQTTKLTAKQLRGLLMQSAAASDAFAKAIRRPHGALAPDLLFINKSTGVKLLPIEPRSLLAETTFTLTPPFQFPAYQSPEAYHPNPLASTADTYAMAAIIYSCLNAKPAFALEDTEALRVRRELKAPNGITKDQWSILQSAFATTPEERPSSPSALVKALFSDTPEEESTTAPTISPENDEHEAPLPSSKSTSDAEPPRSSSFSTAWLKPVLIFTVGFALGCFLSLLWLQVQQQQMADGLNAWKTQAQELRTANEALNEQLNTLLEQQANIQANSQANVQAESREEAPLQDNFEVFRDALTSGGYGPDMLTLPAGQYRMGDLNRLGDDNEKPVQTIQIARPFALSRFEVSFAEYDRFADASGRKKPDDNGWGRGNQPVVNVSWNDAQAYVQWLREQTGQPYRLPSEAEWEYAARAGSDSAYWWGNELSDGRAVCDECGSQWDGKQPAPIGSLPANPWGLYDMNGNVDEWVADCYADNYEGYPANGAARQSPRCDYRSMRGGSWFDIGRVIRSASRYRHPPDTSRNTWGFRIALDIKES